MPESNNSQKKEKQAQQASPFDETILSTELECCYNEFKYYKEKVKNEIAAFGFAVSYNLQFLWQNSPKIDKITNLSQTIKQTNIGSQKQQIQEIQNFLKTKGIEPLGLCYTPYPRDIETLEDKTKRQKAEKYSHHKNNKPNPIREHKRPIRFYATLDWDKFYMNFPIVKRLSKNYLNNQKIYNTKFTSQMEAMLIENKYIIAILKELPQGSYIFNFAIDIRENRSDLNKDSYIILRENEATPQGYKLVSHCKPYEIDTLNCQNQSFSDEEFMRQAFTNLLLNMTGQFSADISAALLIRQAGKAIPMVGQTILAYEAYNVSKEINQQSWNDTMQDLSLYACSGKFSLNYAPTKISIRKQIKSNTSAIEYRIDEMVAYVYDSFDFLDQYHDFNDEGEIIKLGQPVGAWDFNQKAFSILGSIKQMATYKPEMFSYIISTLNLKIDIGSLFKVEISDILQSSQTNPYYLYNQDYQDYQKFTPYGLDFRLYSKDIIKTLDFKDFPFKTLYSTIGYGND
ncbi:DUF6402 family protein [Helicobacter sp. T3_23-1059]